MTRRLWSRPGLCCSAWWLTWPACLISLFLAGRFSAGADDQETVPSPAVDAEFTHGERLFSLHVQPLLARKCWSCHGIDPEDLQGGLDLTSREGMIRGGDSGVPALLVHEAARSPLYQSVTWQEPDLRMPPKEADRLTEQEAWHLRDWINAGAPWPDAARQTLIRETYQDQTLQRVATSGGLSPDWDQRLYVPDQLWAYQPLTRPQVPHDSSAADVHPIDAFLNQRMRELGVTPASRADRQTLIRRATFDLLGLPPSPEEIEQFLSDPAPEAEAFAALIERLLASPHYGERMAQHWLDVVRYADSGGLSNDYERPNAWRYRDYVVRAFQSDLPYDEFVRQQIAGDELDPERPEALIATGFLRMGPWEHTAMSVARVTRQQFLDDITDTVGQVFLSHPLQCCRCHDHKFDPIPTRDYYAIQAVFATTQFADRDAPFLAEENLSGFKTPQSYLLRRIENYRNLLTAIAAKEEAAAREWYAARGADYAPRQELLRQGVPESQIAPRHLGLEPIDHGLERIARKGLQRHQWELDRYRPIAFAVYTGSTHEVHSVNGRLPLPADPWAGGRIEQTCILAGGDVFSPTIPVEPGVLSCLFAAQGSASLERVPADRPRESARVGREEELEVLTAAEWASLVIPNDPHGRRAAFARWLTAPDHPLVTRSIVNRVWQWHFGWGIVSTPNNFGTMGSRPSHPELLDWLARRFVEDGWSIKSLHRWIMTSEAYCRSCDHPRRAELLRLDPLQRTGAVFIPRRLSAEELRDALLAVTGELNREVGGVPICPDIHLEVALQPRQVMGTYAPAWQPSPLPEQRHRRSLYILRWRGLSDPFLDVFDRPGPDLSCELREASTVAPQALAMFNSPVIHDRALALAARLLEESPAEDESPDSSASVIARAFLLVTGRAAAASEIEACQFHWERMTAEHQSVVLSPTVLPPRVTRSAVEEMTGEVFEFVEELEQHQDYVPDLKPWQVDARTRGLAEVCLVLLNLNEFLYVY